MSKEMGEKQNNLRRNKVTPRKMMSMMTSNRGKKTCVWTPLPKVLFRLGASLVGFFGSEEGCDWFHLGETASNHAVQSPGATGCGVTVGCKRGEHLGLTWGQPSHIDPVLVGGEGPGVTEVHDAKGFGPC